jgi:hypothetical protein
MGVECLNQLGKISQRPGQPVDLVHNDHIDLVSLYVSQQPLEGRAVD